MVVQVTLKCLDDGHKAVKIAQGKTTIGRGPLLGCGDKKVSRNHAILEVTEEGKVNLTPIHVNPCFYQGKSVGLSSVLKKDKPQQLHTGDTFSLLPNSFRYQVVIEREESESSSDSSESTKPPSPVKKDEIIKEEEKHDNESSPEPHSPPIAAQPTIPEEKEETVIKDSKEPPQVKVESETNVQSSEDKIGCNSPQKKHSEDDEKVKDPEDADKGDSVKLPTAQKMKHQTVVPEQKPRKRTLPSWLLKCTKVSVAEEETKRNPPKNRHAVVRTEPRRTSHKRYSSDNDNKVSAPTPSKVRTSRQNRQTRQRISLDDYIVSDDDEWDDRSEEEYKPKYVRRRRGDPYESGSDWEAEHGKKRRGRARESGSDLDDDHMKLRKRPRISVDIDSGSDWERDRTRKKVTPKGRGRRHKKASESGSESDDNDKASTSDKKRLPCMYGKDCYRKNPGHLEKYIHPGDSDFAEPSDDAEGNDNNKPECPYGVDCYRKNPQHRKDYKHGKRTLPKREAAKKAGKKVNMIDDEYSFNDDESDEYAPGASEQDVNSDSEDVTRLVKETKAFVRNKKHQNAV